MDNLANREFQIYKPDLKVFSSTPYHHALENVRLKINAAIHNKSIEEYSEVELKGLINRCIENNNITSDLTDDPEVLVNHIYHDMAKLSFISREGLFEKDGFEEININRWNDIEIISHGTAQKTNFSFISPTQAEDILRRIFRTDKIPFDDAKPHATANLTNGVRITAMRSPLIDSDVGVTASIRKVDSTVINREAILANGTLTAEMQQFLEVCLRHGISICISGQTGTGKTTLASSLLYDAAKSLRVFTIEEGAREWDFVQYDDDGRVANSIVHTKTRIKDDDPTQNIDQELLCKLALRYDASIVAPSEIRGKEAYEVMGIANTGHTVCTTVHSNGTRDTPGRIVDLAKKAYDMSDTTLYTAFTRAFPLLVHLKKGADKSRRVTEILEVVGYTDGELQTQMLYEFIVEDNIEQPDGSVKVVGDFQKVNVMTEQFKQKLMEEGASRTTLAPFLQKGSA